MKPFHIIMAVLPLVAIAIYQASQAPQNAFKQSTTESQSKPSSKAVVSIDQKSSAPSINTGYDKEMYEHQRKSIMAKIVESEARMAELAQKIGPTVRGSGDALVSSREPQYQKLFRQWNLSPEQTQKVLGILSEKRDNLMNDMIRKMKETPAEVGDRSDPVVNIKHAQKITSMRTTAEWQAEEQLLPILGTQNYRKLMALDKELDQIVIAKENANKAD